jgi:RNA polymerase sigma-70 factor (ECF subfamily)
MHKLRPRSAPDPALNVGEFGELAQQHREHLHLVALRLAGDRDVAKDLVQETLVRALFHFSEYVQGTNARAWLVTILTRLYLDQRKHEKVVTEAGPRIVTMELVERDIDLTTPNISDATLWRAVDSLEPGLRQIVELRYAQQLTYREIASRLGLTVGTVGTRLMRAHDQLRRLLQADET